MKQVVQVFVHLSHEQCHWMHLGSRRAMIRSLFPLYSSRLQSLNWVVQHLHSSLPISPSLLVCCNLQYRRISLRTFRLQLLVVHTSLLLDQEFHCNGAPVKFVLSQNKVTSSQSLIHQILIFMLVKFCYSFEFSKIKLFKIQINKSN